MRLAAILIIAVLLAALAAPASADCATRLCRVSRAVAAVRAAPAPALLAPAARQTGYAVLTWIDQPCTVTRGAHNLTCD